MPPATRVSLVRINVTFRRSTFLFARALLRALGIQNSSAVLILGHMRCGSTLLLHLLLTSSEIISYGERNASYSSLEDLDKLEIASRIAQRAPLRRIRYCADQINHDRFTPNIGLLRDNRVRCVFLIRDPQFAIPSILNLTRNYYAPWSVARAVDYYSSRLAALAGYANHITGHQEWLALKYDDVVYDT